MTNTSKYRETLLQFLDIDTDIKNIMNWVESQPDLEQPDILRELRSLFLEKHEKTGETHWLNFAKHIEDGVDDFEEEILDEKLHKNLFCNELEHALKDVEFTLENVTTFATFTREALINSFITDPEQKNNKKFWNAVHLAIKFEKNTGIYDENNWSAIM